ncbi:MAG: hypothetical protein LLF83_00975 [Methanobacterium sp.]|nr:hypothetical protein [Methanobacterium sp.]
MAMDPTVLMNFIFSLIITIIGFWVYQTKKIVLAMYIALSFGLFTISHLAILLGTSSTDLSIMIIRALGYLVLIYALIREVKR